MSVALSISTQVILLSNILDGRWFALSNLSAIPDCRSITVNEHNLTSLVGNKISILLQPIVEELLKENIECKNYNDLPFHHLIFNTTEKCNLSCKYCYFSANSSGESINEDIIEHSIRKCLDYMNDDSKLTVLFQGGEALLGYNAIRRALENLGEQPRIQYQIQTNGTLINKEIMDFFEKFNIHVSYSMDSYLQEHNNLRSSHTGSFTRKILQVADMFKERGIDYGVISVVCKNNIEDLKQLFHEFVQHGSNMFAYNLLWPIGRAESEGLDDQVVPTDDLIDSLFAVYKEIYEFNIEQGYAPFEKFRERNLYMLWRRLFYRKLSNYMCMNTPCGAGVNTLTVDTNGLVYPCALMLPSLRKGFEIGNIYTDSISTLLNQDSLIKHRHLDQIPNCGTCSFRASCSAGGCGMAFYHYKDSKNINAPSMYCNYYYGILFRMIEHAMQSSGVHSLKNY
ncbi:radical SAM protein [Paenibacillus sp. FSL P2-0089]|uniref:radical SAM/SPASM domain-containing protein n=1 Tax=Paenibacillus sp. FSL P2-0089 TaxID=2954526 RepID=UPI00315B31B7